MKNGPDMSRRDWFRLRVPRENAWLDQEQEPNNAAKSLAPIELPPNHDGMDLADLPPLREATLMRDEFVSLLDDIQTHGNDIQLMQRRTADSQRTNVLPVSTAISTAKQAFLRGKVSRLQIRYRWQDSLWIDTIENRDDQIRLVRIAHSNA